MHQWSVVIATADSINIQYETKYKFIKTNEKQKCAEAVDSRKLISIFFILRIQNPKWNSINRLR